MPIPSTRSGSAGVRLALFAGGALGVALLAGCSGAGAIRSADAGRAAAAGYGKADKPIARAEAVVARAPQNAALRASLGQAYLAAGRFESAAQALSDAMQLGEKSGRTALGLALAETGAGYPRDAVAVLDANRSQIPAADLGLALALAGETARGVAILSDAVRSGESTPKLRQNLAYAYALDGRWGDARVMAAQDVPAAELQQRLAMWALSTLPDRNRDRVAGLLGTPVRADQGQPAALALNLPSKQLAAEGQAASVADGELPAVASTSPAARAAASPPPPVATLAANLDAQRMVEPVAAPLQAPVSALPKRISVARAFAPMRFAAAAKPAVPVSKAIIATPAGGTHLVQLGAFSTEQGARRAWGHFVQQNPALAGYRMVITPATVAGRPLWRVAAGGFAARFAATGMCAQLRAKGGACFAYAAPVRSRALPATGNPVVSGPLRARR